ncbi:MAG TPA: undecaprenyl-diphosphate phosphatase [Spirochaetota bacterium]|mgnify:FL=1|nr:undecaprenyl-diphosphate phosphatase [Spirochaetota bacterium]
MNDYIISVILGIVEGFTEFLPISSTGHLIIVNEFTGFTGEYAKMYDVVIQLGAILSVVVYFRKKLFPFFYSRSSEEKREVWNLWFKAVAGVLPALFIGALVHDFMEDHLFTPTVVSTALILWGIFLILIENKKHISSINSVADLSYKTAILIGFIQCLAMVPGTSRSAATIIGAMLLGTSRQVAAEFSFFLAVPTMFAASAYTLMKHGYKMDAHQAGVLGVGFVVSFIVALLVIAVFMNYIRKHDFKVFGWYRIVLGIAVLAYFWGIK